MAYNNKHAAKKPVEFESSEEEEYEVERIVDHKIARRARKKVLQYYIKWKGYDSDENTWEPEDAVDHAAELVNKYWKEKGQKARKVVDQELGRTPKALVASNDEFDKNSLKRKRASPEVSTKTKKARKEAEEGDEADDAQPYYESESEMDFSESEVEDNKFRINANWLDVSKVEAVRPAEDGKTLYAVVRWNDGKLAKYPTAVVGKKSPLKLIDYYEKRLLFEKIH